MSLLTWRCEKKKKEILPSCTRCQHRFSAIISRHSHKSVSFGMHTVQSDGLTPLTPYTGHCFWLVDHIFSETSGSLYFETPLRTCLVCQLSHLMAAVVHEVELVDPGCVLNTEPVNRSWLALCMIALPSMCERVNMASALKCFELSADLKCRSIYHFGQLHAAEVFHFLGYDFLM